MDCFARAGPDAPVGLRAAYTVFPLGSALTWKLCIICNARAEVSAQFRPEFFSNEMSVRAIADNLRTDEDDPVRYASSVVLMGKAIAQRRNLIEHGNPYVYR
jgi:hypothetical protein